MTVLLTCSSSPEPRWLRPLLRYESSPGGASDAWLVFEGDVFLKHTFKLSQMRFYFFVFIRTEMS